MKRFTKYLYECQGGQRVRNIGFVKAELETKSGKIVVQARRIDPKEDKEMKIFLFYPKDGEYESVFQGTVLNKDPILQHTFWFGEEDIGEVKDTEKLAGLLLESEKGIRYVSIWNEEDVNVERIRERQSVMEELSVEEEKEEDVEELICEKIGRKDLVRLPRKDWYLANNNFLLHGFYNYHHLLWLEEGETVYVGVPGVYHPREMQVANAFGFPEFRTAVEVGAGIGREEAGKQEDFGYYCRRIVRNK